MKNAFRSEGIGMAFLHFFIGILVLVLAVGLFDFLVLSRDYSDEIKDPEYSFRPYVVAQITPEPTAEPTAEPTEIPAEGEEVTLPPYATPTPTPEEPTPPPTPSPTPGPTAIPASMVLPPAKRTNSQIPAISKDIRAGLTHCYVSPLDGYRVMEIDGYAYFDDENFDGAREDNDIWLVVTRGSENLAYIAYREAGVSGRTHAGAGKNLEGNDFRAFIDVSNYADDVYSLGIVLKANNGKKDIYASYKFEKTLTFVVRSGEVISPIQIV